jgi:predicted amidohydrolase YtcJ
LIHQFDGRSGAGQAVRRGVWSHCPPRNGSRHSAPQTLRAQTLRALTAWTRGGAFASFQERTCGSLEAGKQADFLILAADPTKADPEKIRTIAVETTVIAGKVVAGTDPF